MWMKLVLQVHAWDRRDNVNWWWWWMEKVMESPKFWSIWDSLSGDTDLTGFIPTDLAVVQQMFHLEQSGWQTDSFRFYPPNQGQNICSKSTHNHVQNAHFYLNLSLCLRLHGWRTLNVKICLKSLVCWYCIHLCFNYRLTFLKNTVAVGTSCMWLVESGWNKDGSVSA